MIGFPKQLNTQNDIENLKERYPKELQAYLQQLLEGRFFWATKGDLSKGEEGIIDDTHKVISIEAGGQEVLQQLELWEDPEAKLFRLGMKVSEAEAIIAKE